VLPVDFLKRGGVALLREPQRFIEQGGVRLALPQFRRRFGLWGRGWSSPL
jgi:hypothetical protein